jgi:hypothetical protein
LVWGVEGAEVPEVPDYEYIMPPPREVSAETLSKEELKVGGIAA